LDPYLRSFDSWQILKHILFNIYFIFDLALLVRHFQIVFLQYQYFVRVYFELTDLIYHDLFGLFIQIISNKTFFILNVIKVITIDLQMLNIDQFQPLFVNYNTTFINTIDIRNPRIIVSNTQQFQIQNDLKIYTWYLLFTELQFLNYGSFPSLFFNLNNIYSACTIDQNYSIRSDKLSIGDIIRLQNPIINFDISVEYFFEFIDNKLSSICQQKYHLSVRIENRLCFYVKFLFKVEFLI